MSNELIKILFAIGIGQCFLLAVILLLPRTESRQARGGLALFLVVMGLMLWDGYARLAGEGFSHWRLGNLMWVNVSLFGPSLWFYVTGLTRGTLSGKAWHLLPAAGILLALLVSKLVARPIPALAINALMWSLYAQVSVYLLLAIRELLGHRRKVRANLSSLSGQSLAWLNMLIVAFAVIWALDFSVVLLDTINQRRSAFAYQLLLLAESAWVIGVGFVALRQPDILHRQLLVEPARKYQTSALSDSAAAQLAHQLQEIMQQDQPHLESDLTLPGLAARLGVTPHLLSQLLNENLGCNFYEFVNKARVREAQTMLRDHGFAELAIIDIAYQAGFNNKNSFNKAFRKFTSLTPSEYRRAQLN